MKKLCFLLGLTSLGLTFAIPLADTNHFNKASGFQYGRALEDLIDTFDSNLKTGEVFTQAGHKTETIPTRTANTLATATSTGPATNSGIGLLGHLTGYASTTLTNSGGRNTLPAATSIPTGYSVIGTIPPLPTHSSWTPNTKPYTAPTTSDNTDDNLSSSKPSSGPPQPSSSPSSVTREWKIIGVAVIAFSAVAAVLLLSVFFDQWWRFMKDMCGRRRKGGGKEELVPDWEKASWDFQVEKESEGRYPSLSSLDGLGAAVARKKSQKSGVQGQGQRRGLGMDIEEVQDGGMAGVGSGMGAVEKEADITTAYLYDARQYTQQVSVENYCQPSNYVSPVTLTRTPSLATPIPRLHPKFRRESSQRNPFENPRSPAHKSIYGGIAD